MINNIKGEVERRTGLPANVVDQVITALGEIVSERYPQYASMIGPMLGIPTTQGGASGTASTAGATGGQGMPDLGSLGSLGNLGGLFGGQAQGGPGAGSQGGSSSGTTNKG